jgi:hypothetical protein
LPKLFFTAGGVGLDAGATLRGPATLRYGVKPNSSLEKKRMAANDFAFKVRVHQRFVQFATDTPKACLF